MAVINPPVKPFPNYKWRWAVLTPTESLNSPPIFLGVLRVFNRYTNHAPGSNEIISALSIVQQETASRVDLARTAERNLVRNSGQYWKALGLLSEAHGKVIVTPFGQLLAEGKITQVEFATTIIKTLELPNRKIESPTNWDNVGLTIKPLELILSILSELGRNSPAKKYITVFELVKIIIPLAGVKAIISLHVDAILQYRQGILDVSTWPNCAPSSNDMRMAREFLLFLTNYGFLNKTDGANNELDQYYLSSISQDEINTLRQVHIVNVQLDQVVQQLKVTQIPANIERKRVSREILERPYQAVFRKNIFVTYGSTCLLTGVTIESVLEAAHIKPIQFRGTDNIDNGLCLRSDIHQLFDSNQLRILPDGKITISALAATRNNYDFLPRQINLPLTVNTSFLEWRVKYY